MKILIDTEARTLTVDNNGACNTIELYSEEAFDVISREWVRVGWSQKYQYTFSWMGRPIIQLPEDLVRMQEVIFRVMPDVIIETGVAHGGSLVFYASLFSALGKGRVIGIDIDIRSHNRAAIESHIFANRIALIEGSSTSESVIAQVGDLIQPGDKVMVVLDSNHTRQHVLDELAAYAPLVTLGSYIVATDGVMRDLADVPRGKPEWILDNPATAAREFAANHPEFLLEQPAWSFRESNWHKNITHWPDAWLKRIE